MMNAYIKTNKAEIRQAIDLYLVLNNKYYVDVLISLRKKDIFYQSPNIFGFQVPIQVTSEDTFDYESKKYYFRSFNKLVKNLRTSVI